MYKKPFLFILVSLLWFCSTANEKVQETIIAKVGDKTISVNEFIRRAEYTIRPVWCKSDNYIHRKIVLNSLIAEKLLALEAGPENKVTANPGIQAYLTGRKEQTMRRLHFNKQALQQAEVDPAELAAALEKAGRTYEVSIIPVNDDELAKRIEADLNAQKITFEALAEEFSTATNQELATEDITHSSPVDDRIFGALFLNDVKDEQVIGPIHLDKNNNVFIKINGWIKRPLISETEAEQIKKDISGRIKESRASEQYSAWVADLMRGKKLEFNPEVFRELVNIVGPDYFKSDKDKKQAFNKKFWNKDREEMILDDLPARMERIENEPLLTIDDQVWTVARFEQELKVHPLVFRNRKMRKQDFGNQFRLAIADMIRDKFITEKAYAEGLDKDFRVKRDVQMWKDNLLALYERNKILENVTTNNSSQLQIVTEHLDPGIAELRKKYSHEIKINTDAFEKIQLSSVDMFVIQKNVSFPVMVPQFPQLTTHNMLDYGSKM